MSDLTSGQSKVAAAKDIKPRPNHQRYLAALRDMTPEQRLRKAFELSAMTKKMLVHALRQRFPDASDGDLRAIMLKRLERCHNRNY